MLNKLWNRYNLIQFVEKGRTITYLSDLPVAEYEGCCDVYAVFRVKLKDDRNWFEKLLTNWFWNKYWNGHLVASQVNKYHDTAK